ncbi:CHAD domain-containing protein [Ideonella sp. A 288]|uniref:CYTH and CHAD domain-containing protein n=1 Tax=Ideonella sp. A 288 TaxID=1962181 RepID=UPI001F263866|nr:CHAD domain-containing protein [Ideonella sp. A 288]
MTNALEVELKFLVPAAARAAVAAEMARGAAPPERTTLAAMYLDTDDRRLARAGMAWRLRREGRRWVQALKAGGANALERFEHEVVRPDATHDASAHAGTPVGDRLLALLRQARADGVEPRVRFQTQVRRTSRRVRTRGAVVEIAFDEGRLMSSGATATIREIEFELVSGSVVAMLALVERWRKRFGLVYDPRSKAERGDRLAEGSPYPVVRKAARPDYAGAANALQAYGTVVDECLSQITRNAIGLAEGDPAQRVEHLHQLRVGIRRLRSAARSFRGWVPAPPLPLVAGLRGLFATLGRARDGDVMDKGVVAELAQVGAPPLTLPGVADTFDPVAALRSTETQQMFLGWIAWRAALPAHAAPAVGEGVGEGTAAGRGPGRADPPPRARASGAEGDAKPSAKNQAAAFHRDAARRLRRWQALFAVDRAAFDGLDEASLHALRKRIKRQRYAVEFFAPGLRRRAVDRYLIALADLQERMGELNDLFVARARYQALVGAEPAAWFALGWLTARIASARARVEPALARLVKVDPPRR